MEISLGKIIDKIRQYPFELHVADEESVYIKKIMLIGENFEKFASDSLCIGYMSKLSHLTPSETKANILCIADIPVPVAFLSNSADNLIILSKNIDIAEVFNEIQDMFTQEQRRSTMLLNSLLRGRGLQHIMDTGYELLGNPLVFTDISFKLLSYSKNVDIEDPLTKELIKNGYFPIETLSFLHQEKWNEKVVNSQHPIKGYDGTSSKEKIIGKVTVEGKWIGNLGIVQQNQPFSDNDIELVSLLCDLISSEIQKSHSLRNIKGLMYEPFIADILDGNITDSEVINERTKFLNLCLTEELYILVLSISKFDSTYTSISYVRNMLEGIISNSRSVIYNEYIVILINRSRKKPLKESDFDSLLKLLPKYKIYGGLSRRFSSLTNIREYYSQALRAIEMGTVHSNEKYFFKYDDFFLKHIIEICSRQNEPLSFCHPYVFDLMEHDRINSTSYSKTFYSYLQNAMNSAITAEAVFIHRNTVNLHIKKIEEILNIDLNNGDLLFQLYFSFKILEYVNNASFRACI